MKPEILKNLENVMNNHKNIGLLISGGFDSTLLSYLAHSYRRENNTNNTFEFFTVPRYDDSTIHAERIINYLYKEFDVSWPWHIVGDPDLHFTQQVASGIREVLLTDNYLNIDMLLTGDNIIPPKWATGPPRKRGEHPRLYKPFFDYTKDTMVQLAIDMNLTEIMTITHTCTESKTLRCNMCWQCKERAWAFKKCNYTDPGTM
jgi:hypothetical protein